MTLRVLHIGKFFPPERGGMETFLADLIHAQRAQGIEAFAIVHGKPLPDDPPWLVRVPVQASLAYAPVALGFRSALAGAIERFRPHLLHLHMPNNSAFWAFTVASCHGLPWIVHWHSDVVFSETRKILQWASNLYRPFEQAVLERSDRIVATSPPYLAASPSLAPWREKCIVVPLGLTDPHDPPSIFPQPPPWRAGTLRLLSIGRLTHYKGFETLIRAVARLPDTELLIAGAGELHSELQALIQFTTPAGQEPATRLLGEVSESVKHDLLQSCDVLCLASRERSEAFGLVLLEAMRQERPCLVSDLAGSGMPWLVEQASCGALVKLDDVQAWRDALERFAADPAQRRSMGEAGRRAFDRRFTADACARTLGSHYRALIEEGLLDVKDKDLLIVIPARNEAQTISRLVLALKQASWIHVLVVDDHSDDDTAAEARSAGARVMQPVLPMGAWGAMQAGIRYALSRGYRAVITMDADGQHEVGEIPELLRMRERADLVIGAYPERASKARRIAWRWFTHLTGLNLEDLTSGFRCYNQAAMRVLASEEATLLDYQDVGTLLMVRKAGLRICEVPVTMKMRTVGKSRIFNSWLGVGRYMALTTLLCLSRWRIRPDTDPTRP